MGRLYFLVCYDSFVDNFLNYNLVISSKIGNIGVVSKVSLNIRKSSIVITSIMKH